MLRMWSKKRQRTSGPRMRSAVFVDQFGFTEMNAFVAPVALDASAHSSFASRTSISTIHKSWVPSKRFFHNAKIEQCGRAPIAMTSSPVNSSMSSTSEQGVFGKVWNGVTLSFPVLTIVAAAVALAQPGLFSGLTGGTLMRRMLSLLMLSTGLTLTGRELSETTRRPWPLLFALLSCYGAMPALAIILMKVFGLRGMDGAGLVLLGVVSGGQMSNLCTLIAGGDVALSVAMTTLTSVASVVAIPWLSGWLLGQTVEVNVMAVGRSTLELVAVPLLIGAGINTLFPRMMKRVKGILPVIGIGCVLVLIAGPVAEMSGLFFSGAQRLALPVVALHVLGGVIGFGVPKLLGGSRKTAVATGFEAGFKSPVLSYVLARTHFGDGVGLASVVSIVVLAPLAALFAVMLRLVGRDRGGEDGEVGEVGRVDKVSWKGYVGGGAGGVEDNTRMVFRVVGKDGTSTVVGYEQLRVVLDRTRRRGGVRSVERVTCS